MLKTALLDEITDEDWHDVYSSTVDSVMYTTRAFIKILQSNHGVILNNASETGLQSFTSGRKTYMYASAKSAVVKFTQVCALNYSDSIRINCIAPGIIDTPIYTNRDFSRFNGTIPMNRVGTAEEVAKVSLFLCSEDSSYITGAIIPIDGGSSLK